ncbi:hypothetical protein [Nostoc sp.]|uniref:hypothetical protein n=1 Tax=Nostoc sp. TaxID=1180 RepID=UPI002FFC245D
MATRSGRPVLAHAQAIIDHADRESITGRSRFTSDAHAYSPLFLSSSMQILLLIVL